MQKKNLWQDALYWVLLLALLTAGGFLLFTNLGETGISDCDEARHGINAYEMMQSGDYVVTTYRGEPDYWNLKPPLTDYCIMLGYRIFGYNALGLRFYSALSMMLTMIVLALWTRRRYGRIASLCTQLMLLGCGLIYGPHFARFGDADAQMLLFYVVAMICMLESRRTPRLLYGTALCFGLAFMSKSWHAALIPVTCLVYLVVTGEIRRLKPRHYLGLIFFGLLPIAPWAIARYQRDGLTFFEKMLSIDVVKRATSVHEEHWGGTGYYVSYLLSDRAVLVAAAAVLLEGCAVFAAFPGPMGCSAVVRRPAGALQPVREQAAVVHLCVPAPPGRRVWHGLRQAGARRTALRMESLATPGLPGCGGCHDGFPGPEELGERKYLRQ